MENTFEFKFYPHDFVLGYWPQIFVYHFAPGFIDVWDYIGRFLATPSISTSQCGQCGAEPCRPSISTSQCGQCGAEPCRRYISSFIDTGDEGYCIVESGPVWS